MAQLKIVKVNSNGLNGHLTVHARIVDEKGEGAMESHGIDSVSLQNLYGGDQKKWLKTVFQRMHKSHCDRSVCHHEVIQLQGKTLDLTDLE